MAARPGERGSERRGEARGREMHGARINLREAATGCVAQKEITHSGVWDAIAIWICKGCLAVGLRVIAMDCD